MTMRRCFFALVFLSLLCPALRAASRLHRDVLVFIPAYEGSQLVDPTLLPKGDDPACVWGSVEGMTNSKFYFCLRMPNPLEAQPMLTAGPIDVYGKFIDALTGPQDKAPKFTPYTPGADFFTFNYDWRQEIATGSVPELVDALNNYARIHEQKTGIPAAQTKFVIVTHSMGGLIARTLLGAHPEWAPRVTELVTVGCPNLGSVKAIKTLVTGPGGLKENAINFPVSLLNLLPNNVDVDVTKLTVIARPSLYELLPFIDPRWECVEADGSRHRVAAEDLLTIGPWKPYWPSAGIEQRLFIDGWLKNREAEGRKKIVAADWEFCQDPLLGKLQKMLAQTRDWRLKMGSLSYTSMLLTAPGETPRLKVVLGTGLKTPTGVITGGAHDFSTARYTYAPDDDGDETVTGTSALDDLHGTPDTVKLLEGVSHGKLMSDPQFLTWFWDNLSSQPLAPGGPQLPTATEHHHTATRVSETVP
jgi:pimeloyl-ACP methyl ester carboxylesterase